MEDLGCGVSSLRELRLGPLAARREMARFDDQGEQPGRNDLDFMASRFSLVWRQYPYS
jgi:hypothetical protein